MMMLSYVTFGFFFAAKNAIEKDSISNGGITIVLSRRVS